MTPEDMAICHARAFAGQGRAWTEGEFADLFASPFVFAVGDIHAFALGRVVADEAELLTLATDPEHRRKGLAQNVLAAFEGEVEARSAERIFLEVAADNTAALALYVRTGYNETTRRAGYYETPMGRVDAVIMEKRL